MVEIDIVRLILAPESLSILFYYFIPGYVFFAFIRFKEFYGLQDKWKVITGLDTIIFSIVISIIFSVNFALIFYAFIGFSVAVISVLGMLCVQLPVHYFEKSNSFKAEYIYLAALCAVVTFSSDMSYNIATASYLKLLSPAIGLLFYLLMFKILRYKLLEMLRPIAKNDIRFW